MTRGGRLRGKARSGVVGTETSAVYAYQLPVYMTGRSGSVSSLTREVLKWCTPSVLMKSPL